MGRNTVSVIGREAVTTANASAFSLQSLGMCSSFQAENIPKRCLTKDTYFAFGGLATHTLRVLALPPIENHFESEVYRLTL